MTGSCGAVRANTHTPHPLPLQVELARRHEGAHDVVRHVAARSLVQLHHGRDDVDELLVRGRGRVGVRVRVRVRVGLGLGFGVGVGVVVESSAPMAPTTLTRQARARWPPD